jgi:arylformamidase
MDPGFLRGAVMISDIYDPAPAIGTTVNAQLRLTPQIAQRHNVEQRPPLVRCPVALFAGGLEPWHWIDQTFRYAHHLHRHEYDPEVHVLPGYNHFDIVRQFLAAASPIPAATLRVAR